MIITKLKCFKTLANYPQKDKYKVRKIKVSYVVLQFSKECKTYDSKNNETYNSKNDKTYYESKLF